MPYLSNSENREPRGESLSSPEALSAENGGGSPRFPSLPRPGFLRNRGHLVLLALIVLTSLALRSAWVAYANPDPNDGRFDDTVFYDHAARSLAAGEGYIGFSDQPTAQWPPGYPLLLAGIYKAFGHHVISAKALNIVVGAATSILVYLVAARIFDRKTGLLAALIFALFPGQIYFSTLVMTESIFPALALLLLLLVLAWTVDRRDPSRVRLLLLGILFGAAALIRAEAAVLLVAVLVVWKLLLPSWRTYGRWAGLLVLGAAVAVTPWAVRNALVMNAFIPIASGAGHTLLAGHQEDPYGENAQPEEDLPPEEAERELMEWLAQLTPGEREMWERIAEKNRADCVDISQFERRLSLTFPEAPFRIQYADLPYPEREVKVENESMREALGYIRSHPMEELRVLPKKFRSLYENDSDALDWIAGAWIHPSKIEWMKDTWVKSLDSVERPVETLSVSEERDFSRLADNYYYFTLAWMLGGIPIWFSFRDKGRLLLVLFVLGWTLAHMVFLPLPRYHAPLIPIFAVWAAAPLMYVWSRVFGGRRRDTTIRDDA